MKNSRKPKTKPVRSRRWRLVFGGILVLGIAVGLAHRPLLRAAGNFLVVSEAPVPSDAIVVLAGGEPARPLEAVRLFKLGIAPRVVITTETPPRVFEQLKRDGIVLSLPWENYAKVIEGYGVPHDHVFRIENGVTDTFDEMERIRDFARLQGWKRLTIVTSNFHTRRAGMTARYVLEPEIQAVVVACTQDSFDPSSWWETQAQTRTFAIEAEKLVTYALYFGPRLLWRRVG